MDLPQVVSPKPGKVGTFPFYVLAHEIPRTLKKYIWKTRVVGWRCLGTHVGPTLRSPFHQRVKNSSTDQV